MFENLIGQDEVRVRLAGDLAAGSLPPSILFAGPPASGKLTAALELARILSCQGPERGAWSCPCGSCGHHRVLTHPDLLLFGRRSFPEEIAVACETLARAPGKAGAFFFIRAVRKLVKRFDPILFEGEEAKLAKAAPLVAELEERMSAIVPEPAPDSGGGKAAKAAEAMLPVARKLEALVADMPPVSQVRASELWSRLAPWGPRKTVIIENAEAMHESARNALLKILEEPPRSLTFVLLSSRRPAMMRTMLSRVRTYTFSARDAASSALVLERVFRVADSPSLEGSGPALLSIERWIASRRPFPPDRAREIASAFVGAALAARAEGSGTGGGPLGDAAETARAEGRDLPAVLALALGETKDFGARGEGHEQSFEALLEGIEGILGDFLRAPGLGGGDLAWIRRASADVREAKLRRDSLKLPASLLLEALGYRLAGRGPGDGDPA